MTNLTRQFAALSLTILASALLIAGAVAPAAVRTVPVAHATAIMA